MGWSKKQSFLVLLLVSMFIILNSSFIWKNMYPIKFDQEVEQAAHVFDVDPYLVLAIIQIESSFRPDIVSHKGATGLMQLMPQTAEWAIERVELPKETENQLNQPDINIYLGSWYLSFLSQKFDGNETAVIAAYNAGPGNVEKWMKQGVWDGREETVSQIPFGETRHYIHRVKYYQGRYVAIYEGIFEK